MKREEKTQTLLVGNPDSYLLRDEEEPLMVEAADSNHLRKRRKLKGSDLYLMAMYAGWILYIMFAAFTYWKTRAWFPMEMTWGTVALFLVETFSLYRLARAKEGNPVDNKTVSDTTQFIESKLGVSGLPSLEEDIRVETEREHG